MGVQRYTKNGPTRPITPDPKYKGENHVSYNN